MRAVGLHHVDLVVAGIITLARKGNLLSVGRPGRFEVGRRVVGEPSGARAVGIHHVDLVVAVAVGYKGDLPAGSAHACAGHFERNQHRVAGEDLDGACMGTAQRAVGRSAVHGDAVVSGA